MADGDQIAKKSNEFVGGSQQSWKMIDAAAATDNGFWVDASKFKTASLEVVGTFVGTLQIMGTNFGLAPFGDAPANATDGTQIGANITAPGFVNITTPCRWIKVKVSAYTSGSISAYLHGLT